MWFIERVDRLGARYRKAAPSIVHRSSTLFRPVQRGKAPDLGGEEAAEADNVFRRYNVT